MNKTDIKALIEQLKEAAERATKGQWRRALTQFNGITNTCVSATIFKNEKEKIIASTSEKRDAMFIEIANPQNVKLIINALEAAQKESDRRHKHILEMGNCITELEQQKQQWVDWAKQLGEESDLAQQRIAELESKKVPDGWKLVPIEPTEDMIIDGFESEPYELFSDKEEVKKYKAMSGCAKAAYRAKLCWAAMLAAAPEFDDGNN